MAPNSAVGADAAMRPQPNVGLLKGTFAHIEAHPEEWEQDAIRCETGLCYAAWACQLDGGRWIAADPDAWNSHLLVPVPADGDGHRQGTPAWTRAQRILGLTVEEADELFSSDKSLEDIRRLVAALCEVEGS